MRYGPQQYTPGEFSTISRYFPSAYQGGYSGGVGSIDVASFPSPTTTTTTIAHFPGSVAGLPAGAVASVTPVAPVDPMGGQAPVASVLPAVPIAVGPAAASPVAHAAAAGTHYSLPTDPGGQVGPAPAPRPGHPAGLLPLQVQVLAGRPQHLDHGQQHHQHQHQHQLQHHLQLHHHLPPLSQLHQLHLHPQHLHPSYDQSQAIPRFPVRPLIMASPNEHDMAAQQEAAKGYQPDLDGPVIGDKAPIAAIVDEYAKADPVYVEKTMALPQTYVHYRQIKGDGNCGWRAIGFSYFEKLVEGGDVDQVEGEVARLTSMNPLLGSVGGYDYYEDWADEAIGLLRDLANCIGDTDTAHALIHERWTDIGTGGALIYYLRLLAATYLKANSDQYDPFVADGQGIQAYCGQSIELPDREIEQLGIIALVNCLLKPVNFVLEIAYLDRSPGTTANVYRFPDEANGKDIADLGPIIYLLYRPDHYDILYRRAASMAGADSLVSATMQINRATNVYTHTPITDTHASLRAYSTADFSLLATLPSAPAPNMSSLSSPDATHASACSPFLSDAPWASPFPASGPPSTLPHHMQDATSPVDVKSPASQSQGALSSSPGSECNIRFSSVQYDYNEEDQSQRPFNVTTNAFKNSVWNRAHFGNPEFRPEQWRPEDEHVDERTSARRKKASRET